MLPVARARLPLGLLLAMAAGVLAGCADESVVASPSPPVVESVVVTPGPHNVLSAVVTASVRDADSVVVLYGPTGEGLESVTPSTTASSDGVELAVLGLLPATAYQLEVLAYGAGGVTASDTLVLTTDALPLDLPTYSAGGSDPTPGYVVFGAYPYGVVIDNTGRVVWYRHLDWGPTLNFQVVATGRYATSPTYPDPGDAAPWVELDLLGNETRRMGCSAGLKSRFHELVAEADGSYWLMCDDTRVMDLTMFGGQPDAEVTGTAVQHVDASGDALFSWTAFDHFAITDVDLASRTGATVNWTHGNAIDFTPDGNLLVSFRSLNEITKIDLRTGAVLWRLGGQANQFTALGGVPTFVGQHGVRMPGAGVLQLLDNRGLPGNTHARRYRIDEASRTVAWTADYFSAPPASSLLGGSTQTLPGGHILVAYGNGNRVQEYDTGGNVVWEIHGNPGYVFRAQRIRSLYSLEFAGSR
ncbi:MAG: arylsulfotransferase family protein [Gemmatimonadales bacterium]